MSIRCSVIGRTIGPVAHGLGNFDRKQALFRIRTTALLAILVAAHSAAVRPRENDRCTVRRAEGYPPADFSSWRRSTGRPGLRPTQSGMPVVRACIPRDVPGRSERIAELVGELWPVLEGENCCQLELDSLASTHRGLLDTA